MQCAVTKKRAEVLPMVKMRVYILSVSKRLTEVKWRKKTAYKMLFLLIWNLVVLCFIR